MDFLKVAAERFVLRLLPEDRARIGSFSDKIRISPQFSSDRDALVRYIYEDLQYGNPTFLWDAIDESMTALSREVDRRVVLIFTDGDDETSRRTDFDQVLSAPGRGLPIYAVGPRAASPLSAERPGRWSLRDLPAATGGGYFELTRAAGLNSTFTRVADELHRQYVLGFTADVLDGTMHALDVRVKVTRNDGTCAQELPRIERSADAAAAKSAPAGRRR
jgi:hypothetical protein